LQLNSAKISHALKTRVIFFYVCRVIPNVDRFFRARRTRNAHMRSAVNAVIRCRSFCLAQSGVRSEPIINRSRWFSIQGIKKRMDPRAQERKDCLRWGCPFKAAGGEKERVMNGAVTVNIIHISTFDR